MSNIERHKVVAEARTWLSTPYHPHGRIKGAGVDCAMLPAEVYHACGLIPEVDPGHYPIDWHLHRGEERYMSTVLDHAEETKDRQTGNFVLFKWGRCFAHGAIIVKWPIIIHAFTGIGVLEQDATKGRFEDREHKVYTLWGDEA